MKPKRKLFSATVVLTLILASMCFSVVSAYAAEEVHSGDCGSKATWVLDSDGVLTIDGEGDMRDYSYGSAPWYQWEDSISKVVISDGITTIGSYVFYGLKSLTEATIGAGVETIKTYAFQSCKNLTKVDLSGNDSLKVIGDGAFENCASLVETREGKLKFPDCLESIGDDAFSGCTSIETVVLPQNTVLEECVFRYDTGIVNAVLPQSAKVVPHSTFSGCTSLVQVDLPYAVEKIDHSAFQSCKSLKFCVVPDTVTELGPYCFAGCESLPEINIPEGIKVIPSAAFSNMKSLINVRLPEKLESLESNAFANCQSLERAVVPATVPTIGGGAFSTCKSLKCIVILGKNTTTTTSCFTYATAFGQSHIPVVIVRGAACEQFFVNNQYKNIIYIDEGFDFYHHTCEYMDWITPSDYSDGNVKHMCKYCGEIVSETVIPSIEHIRIDPWKVPYDGTRKTPPVCVWDRNGDVVDPKYYDVTYPEDAINIGEYEAVLTYKGYYTGTDDISYYIVGDLSNKASKTSATAIANKTYTGKALTPVPTVKAVGAKGSVVTLVNGTDYKLSYSNNVGVGKATISITGKGNYTGTKKVTFIINPKGTSLNKVTAVSKGFKALWTKQATQTTGYQIRYSLKSSMANAKTVTVSKNASTSKKVTKLKAKKKYYVQVRTYKTVNGTKYFSKWSGKKAVKTKG